MDLCKGFKRRHGFGFNLMILINKPYVLTKGLYYIWIMRKFIKN